MAEEKYLNLNGLQYYTRKLNEKKADVQSPAFTGTPTAPTAETGTSTVQVATTEFVQNAITNVIQVIHDGDNNSMVQIKDGNENVVTVLTSDSLNNTNLTGVPTAPTAAVGTNTVQVATTEFVQKEIQNTKHTLTFGKYQYDGTQDVTVEPYTGDYQYTE